MQSIIEITTNAQGAQVVNARDLHEFLGAKKDFSNWIKQRISKYGLIENIDFTPFSVKTPNGRPLTEYALTLDTAKELAMVEGNTKGKQARQYFIECEKKIKAQSPQTLSQIDIIIQSALKIKEQEQRTNILEQKVERLEANAITRPECYTIAGYASIIKVQINLDLAKRIGIEAKKICRGLGITPDKTHDPRWGKINIYPLDIVQEAFKIIQTKITNI